MGPRSDPSRRALGAFSLGAVLLAVAVLLVPASALGQAALDQYVPSNKPGGHHGDPDAAIREATGTAEPDAPPAQERAKKKDPAAVRSSGGGPPSDTDGGGYPLTTFVILVLLLFLIGLAARYLPDLIRRLRLRHVS
jgi:hypothetical protein